MSIDWMNSNWVIQVVIPICVLALLAIALIGLLTLWILTKRESRAVRKTFQAFRLSTEATIAELSARIEGLQSLPAPERNPAPLMTLQCMNMTTRAKVLRMHRRGEAIPSIAAALSVQQEEVQLLLKLDGLMRTPAA